MTNFEFYKDKILRERCIQKETGTLGVSKKGELKRCSNLECGDCILSEHKCCTPAFIKWLYKEYKEPITLTELEKALLKRLQEKGFEYIARDKDGSLYAFDDMKPYKASEQQFEDIWLSSGCYREIIKEIADFSFVRWEDEEPTEILELLGERNED